MTDTESELVRMGGVDQQSLAERERGPAASRDAECPLRRRGPRRSPTAESLLCTGVSLEIYQNFVTAFIGPSGCGKSTFIRCFNRMNDLIPSASVDGRSSITAVDLYGPDVDPVEVRKRIGMVFQKPNPFPKSIYDNVAFGPRVLGWKDNLDERVERALRQAALWDEVKDRLKESALSLSGGQQQRLCIARCLAVEPDVLLMDEPASALDPISTTAIEDLMHELKRDYTIVIVTHNMQQAARVADMTAFFSVERRRGRKDPDRDPRRVRHDAQDLHQALRQANRGLCHGAIRMRITFQAGARPARELAAGGRRSSSCARSAAL